MARGFYFWLLLVTVGSHCDAGSVTINAGLQEGRSSPRNGQYRLPDDRPTIDRVRLRELGIQVHESKRLILLSDLPGDQIQELPALADQLFVELELRLGKLQPAEDGAEFQVTGCLIDARERFERAQLMPPQEFPVRHGRHLNYRFWMFSPATDYYRRHLLLHEFTHCFMSCEYGMLDIPALWYTEGIAEYFGTHLLANEVARAPSFGVLPRSVELFPGWGRISEIRRSFNPAPSSSVLDAEFTPLKKVTDPPPGPFIEDTQYAHAWALFWLLQTHPEYQREFATLRPLRSGKQFAAKLSQIPPAVMDRLAVDWLLFLDSLAEGFDVERSFPRRGEPSLESELLTATEDIHITVAADRSWQHSGKSLRSGETVRLIARGRFQVDDQPKPWISEPQGVTLKYHRGRPLGELVAILVATDGSRASRRIPVGTAAEIQTPYPAQLWLQLNESAADRDDNSGAVDVTLGTARQ